VLEPPAGNPDGGTGRGRALRRLRTVPAHVQGRLARRDPRRWAFGNLKGFRDDARYLAEEVASSRPDLETWWIAANEAEAQQARAAGLRAAVRGERQATDAQRHAGVAFVANGFGDLQVQHLGGAYVVDLRHGQGLKKVLLDMVPRGGMRRSLRRWWIRRRLSQVDMIVAPGEWAKDRFVTAFECPPDRIRVLGMPRFDVIQGGPAYRRVAGESYRASLGIGADQYLVVWLPTWREAGDAAWLPTLREEDVERAARDRDLVIGVKPHPFSDLGVYRERLTDSPRVRLLTERDTDANALLREADALVTDYSSAAFDYAILDRPIYFLTPDAAEFTALHALYAPLESLSGGRQHLAWDTLLTSMAEEDAAEGVEVARRIRQLSRARAEPGSSARIIAAVAEAVGAGQADASRVPDS